MTRISSTAMVLAAGLGSRMRPLTLTKPKPLQLVGGKTMLDHALDKLVGIGIKRAVVNTHYLSEQIEAHLKNRTDIKIIFSHEAELLDTGGGIKKALPHFGDEPFFSLNADLPWIDGQDPSLQRMIDKWDDFTMDALLLLFPTNKAHGFEDKGDFAMDKGGRVHRKDVPPPRPYVWISAQILKPELFRKIEGPVFSNNTIWNECEARGALHGVVHDGTCYHVGTPEDLHKANDLLNSGHGWAL